MVLPWQARARPRRATAHVFGAALLIAGCRFGGSGTSPFAYELERDSGSTGGSAGSSGALVTGGTVDTGSGGDTPAPSTAGGASATAGAADTGGVSSTGPSGASGGDTGSAGAAGGAPEGGATGLPGACQPAQAAVVCDPVRNTGCLVPFSFCDIDPMQSVAAGRCVFPFTSTPPAPDAGSACFTDATTDTCLPTSTCVNKTCRKLCYCDSDCAAGQCCTEPAPGSSSAFHLCRPC